MARSDNLGHMIQQVASSLAYQSDRLLIDNLGITYAQFKILLALTERSGAQQKYLAEYLSQTEASVSRQIKNLKQVGLVTTTVNPSNRREHLTVATKKGERITSEAQTLLNRHFQPLFARLSVEEQVSLSRSLGKLTSFNPEA